MDQTRCIEVLLVADVKSEEDLLRAVFEETSRCKIIHYVSGIPEAMDFLETREQEHLPDLILADLQDPYETANLVQAVKASSALRIIPFVCLVAHEEEKEIIAKFLLKPDEIIWKGRNLKDLILIFEQIEAISRPLQ